MDLETERQLWDEVRRGNKEAFQSLANPLIPRAYRSAYMILRSKQLAEEAVQNALIELYSAIINGKEVIHLRAWFGHLIALRALDVARKERGYKYMVDINGLEFQDGSASPLDSVLKKEQSERLIESIMGLELNQRIVVGLYYFQDMKIEEIAELLDIKSGTVKSRLYHARVKLGGMLRRLQTSTKEITII
ncbi:sigma-70 family RNA polymerase sigma factor [Paenibacillus sp. GYB004]|uniref:RNA polymerase sigma factor n=1 Tax=Paenibacillus sp. GYB004 TaxID=2994393 RepID=UPI002F96A69A